MPRVLSNQENACLSIFACIINLTSYKYTNTRRWSNKVPVSFTMFRYFIGLRSIYFNAEYSEWIKSCPMQLEHHEYLNSLLWKIQVVKYSEGVQGGKGSSIHSIYKYDTISAKNCNEHCYNCNMLTPYMSCVQPKKQRRNKYTNLSIRK